MSNKPQILIASPDKELRVVYPEDLGRGLKANQAAKQFEVDLTDFVGDGISYENGRLSAAPDLSGLEGRLATLEGKTDKFVQSIVPSRNGNTVQLTYHFNDGASQHVEFSDNDTITLAFDPSAIHSRLDRLEAGKDGVEKDIDEAKAQAANSRIKRVRIENARLEIELMDGTIFDDVIPSIQNVRTTAISAFGDEFELTTIVS